MRVSEQHIVDSHHPSKPGDMGYCYEYDLYRFAGASVELDARSYAETAERVSFIGKRIGDLQQPITTADLHLPLMAAAIAHLRAQGKCEFYWFDQWAGAYLRIDLVATNEGS